MAVAKWLVISEMGKQDEVPHSMKLLKNNLFWPSVSDEVIQKCLIYETNMRQETQVFTVRERDLTPSQLSEWTVCVSPEKPIKLSLWYIITNKPNEVNSDTQIAPPIPSFLLVNAYKEIHLICIKKGGFHTSGTNLHPCPPVDIVPKYRSGWLIHWQLPHSVTATFKQSGIKATAT